MHKYKFSGFNQSILHFVTEKEDYLHNQWLDINTKILSKEISQKNMQTESLQLLDLFHLGAIYLNEERLTNLAFIHDQTIPAGQLLRFHLQPRRYFFPWEELAKQIVYEDQDVLAVDKPAGIPVHATVDNQKENLLYHLSQRYSESVLMVHRLDLETQGLILFAKNKPSQNYLAQLFTDRKIRKTYTAILAKPDMTTGLKTHWMHNSQRAPKKISEVFVEDSKICELLVKRVGKITKKQILSQFQLSEQGSYYAAEIELLTGRTHQIRAQLSFLGYPIVGDNIYGGDINSILGLQSSCIEFEDRHTGKILKIQHPSSQETKL